MMETHNNTISAKTANVHASYTSPTRNSDHDVEKTSDRASSPGGGDIPPRTQTLARLLSARQVQMIAIGGTIGTGLFLGTGNSLANGGPASMLISYAIVGAIVFITMLSLGEMAAFIPVAGSFCTFAGRFVDDAFGFALTCKCFSAFDMTWCYFRVLGFDGDWISLHLIRADVVRQKGTIGSMMQYRRRAIWSLCNYSFSTGRIISLVGR
jgi:amino acid permease